MNDQNKTFPDYFTIHILQAYNKPLTKCVAEGTLIFNHQGDLLNLNSEWHPAKVIHTTVTVVQGGADVLTQQLAQGGRAEQVQAGKGGQGHRHQAGQDG